MLSEQYIYEKSFIFRFLFLNEILSSKLGIVYFQFNKNLSQTLPAHVWIQNTSCATNIFVHNELVINT